MDPVAVVKKRQTGNHGSRNGPNHPAYKPEMEDPSSDNDCYGDGEDDGAVATQTFAAVKLFVIR